MINAVYMNPLTPVNAQVDAIVCSVQGERKSDQEVADSDVLAVIFIT